MFSRNWLRSIGVRLYAGVIIFIIIPVIAVFIYSIYTFESIMKEEISQKSIDQISGIEYEINAILDNLITATNAISRNTSLLQALFHEELSYYERTVKIDDEIANLVQNSNPILEHAKITMFDHNRDVYSNWSMNYHNYQFLYDKDWVQEAIQHQGHLIWRLLEPAYIREEQHTNFISLAKAVEDPKQSGKHAGVLIVSLDEDFIIDIFQKSKYIGSEEDSVMIINASNQILLSHDPLQLGKSESVEQLLPSIQSNESGSLQQKLYGKQYLINYYTISRIPWTSENNEWKVIVFTMYEKITHNLNAFVSKMGLFFSLFIIAVLVIAGIITLQIVKPIRLLSRRMTEFNPIKPLEKLQTKRKDEIAYLNISFYNMAYNIQELFAQVESEYRIREQYRFESLRAQLNPHFLFNSLNTIRWMAMLRKADNIVENIDALVKLLDYSMSRGSEYVTLAEEIEHIQSYVLIQNSRYGGKYELIVEVDSLLLEMNIIRFILQPAVENAIIHGYKDSKKEGIILIKAEMIANDLAIYVIDQGRGMDSDVVSQALLYEQEKKTWNKQITGIGLKIVNERLKMSHGYRYGICIKSEVGVGTEIMFLLPALLEEEGTDAKSIVGR